MSGAPAPRRWTWRELDCAGRAGGVAAADVEAWVALFNASFGKQKDRATWAWKYTANPHGPAVARVACAADGRVVGAYAYVPRRFRLDGRPLLLMQASDAMTAPDHRGQGIFTGLDDIVCEAVGAAGVPWSFAYSGRRSFSGFLRNGWEHIGDVPLWRLVYRSRRALRRMGRLGPALALGAPLLDVLLGWRRRAALALPAGGLDRGERRLVRLERFDERAAELFEAAAPRRGLVGVRDPAWLDWRYIDTPTRRHECFAVERDGALDGWLVTEWVDGHGYLVDHLARDAATRRFLLLAFAVLGERRGAQEATALLPSHHPSVADLPALGFRARPGGRAFRDVFPFIVRRCRDDAAPAARQLEAWHLADGDRDAEHMSP